MFYREVPGLDITSSSYFKAVPTAQKGEPGCKRPRVEGEVYLNVPEDTLFALPTSTDQISGNVSLFISLFPSS